MDFLNKLEVDMKTIIVGALSLFYFFILGYALIVYQQFTALEIIATAIMFLIVFIILIIFFLKFKFIDIFSLKMNIYNLLLSLCLFLLLLATCFNEPNWLSYYYSTYPLIETDGGLFWHEDTAYHASLIQSILNFGFPSIAQHDVIPTYYHVLSHYVDALILQTTGLEPYDSYGLLFHFKKWVLVSSVVVFVGRLFINQSTIVFLTIVTLFLPVFIYSWHAVGSHGLWFTTLLLLFLLPNVFNILRNKKVTIKDYLFLFFMIILVSLGKVSTGFFLGVFSGLYLYLKNYKDYKVYVFGALLISFYIFIIYLFNQVTTENVNQMYLRFVPNGVWAFMTDVKSGYFLMLVSIYIFIAITGMLFLFLKNKNFGLIFYSSILSFVVLLIIVNVGTFTINNVGYFVIGVYTIILLFFISSFFHEIVNAKYNKYVLYSLIIFLFVILNISIRYKKINNEVFNLKGFIYNLNVKVFEKINRWVEVPESNNLIKVIKNNYIVNFPKKDNSLGLKQFRLNLYEYMKEKKITKKDTLLFIEKKVFKSEITEKEWAKGMLIYAVLGVPLINGLGDLRPEYGYSMYTNDALRKNIEEINIDEICKNNKTIIIINSFKNNDFNKLCE